MHALFMTAWGIPVEPAPSSFCLTQTETIFNSVVPLDDNAKPHRYNQPGAPLFYGQMTHLRRIYKV